VIGTLTEGSLMSAASVKMRKSCRPPSFWAWAVAKYVGGMRSVLLVIAIFTFHPER
jgi:hypothetical protein